ncbi:MAG TPA: ornithine cyclodeaminase family protein [Candidatus Acidoferrales bacterium]|jgi:ornithine cyclodeaminase/alanine dehydrogenase-like protein (mu-crystallin family)|nr:ornithine cyclodeaminase family protein [Candidatus Acidoferrales bacterium]
MTLLLTEADVRSLLTMPIALEVVEESLRQQGNGELVLHPRRRIKLPDNALLHYMAAGDTVRGYIGMKIYTVARGVARFVVPLFRSTTGEMAALVEADALGQLRTGAATGVATKYLATANARAVCILGTGYQARTQLEAVAAVRRIARVRAFGRDPGRREAFCREMSERIGVAVEPMNSGEEAVRGADILITATSATKIVLEGARLAPGMHINAMGANWPQKRELDAAAVGRASTIVVDSVEQSKMEAGDLIQAFGEDQSRWNAVRELSQIVAGKSPGRNNADEITLFKSNGIATWDLAAAVRVYEMAVARGMGRSVPLWEAEKQA